MPGTFKFFGLAAHKNEDFDTTISVEDKLECITPIVICRNRRKQLPEPLNSIKSFSYNSVNGSLGFRGMTASPFASFATSFLQQRRNNPSIQDFLLQ